VAVFSFKRSTIGPLVLDLEIGAEHRIGVEVTDNPTEDGLVDGGFKRVLPRRVTVRGAITAQLMLPGAAIPFIDGTRHFDAWQLLQQLWTSNTPFDVVTHADKYKNCTGEGELVWATDPGDENVLLFSGTFKELQFGKVNLKPNPAASASLAASEGDDIGKQGTQEVA